ncbi:hypothetical protein FE840_010320 [Peteryoungia desertarenae]|uniref:Uncharacterized protein n=1 Tax=Peteryoungia desertarenae TaxID=1813451 RepID=A0ABX6QMZ8_9HYPH|nr:hypothetical protein [Peteryoungia desertarenae]QLF69898.1 hypothetical protein FE840_010320 [Peteryoungia desertarenae]
MPQTGHDDRKINPARMERDRAALAATLVSAVTSPGKRVANGFIIGQLLPTIAGPDDPDALIDTSLVNRYYTDV